MKQNVAVIGVVPAILAVCVGFSGVNTGAAAVYAYLWNQSVATAPIVQPAIASRYNLPVARGSAFRI